MTHFTDTECIRGRREYSLPGVSFRPRERDGGSRRIEASQKISSRPILEPTNFVGEFYVNLVKKLSKRSFDLYSDSPTTCFP